MCDARCVDRVGELLLEAAALVGSPLELIADRSWPHGVSTVVEAADDAGRVMIVKSPVDVAKFDAEVHAYRAWAPALSGHVPELLAADRHQRVLVLSKLPGDIGDVSPSTFEAAGRLLRRLQGAEPAAPVRGFADQFRERSETWIRRARAGLLSNEEVEFVRVAVVGLAEFDDPLGVPCHRDWQPRNWLTAADGSVAVIDFGNSRVGYWWQDFERLWWSEWRTDPELARAFFDGYGTVLDEMTRVQLRATASQWLLSTIVWADEVDDAAFGDHARTQLAAAMAGIDDPI